MLRKNKAKLSILMTGVLSLFLGVSTVNAQNRTYSKENIIFDRVERKYLFQEINKQNLSKVAIDNSNDTSQGRKYPLIISLHSGGLTADDVFKQNRMAQLAYESGFYFLAPESYNGYWNDGRDVSLAGEKISHVDDVAYILTLISQLSKKYSIDEDSIFVTGFSNGAYLANLLGCRAIGSVFGIATIGSTLTLKNGSNCLNRNLPTLMINAVDDEKTPIVGNVHSNIYGVAYETTYPPFETHKHYSFKNGCGKISPLQLTNNKNIKYSESSSCSGSYKNVYYEFEKLGHNIPGVQPNYVGKGSAMGVGSNDLMADKVIIDFFSKIIQDSKSKK